MSDQVENDLDLSPNGRIRRDEILTHVLQTSRARHIWRRRLSAATIATFGLTLGAVAWSHFGDVQHMLTESPASPRIIPPEVRPTLTDPLVSLYPHLEVEILTEVDDLDPSTNRHHAIAVEGISDEQLISQIADIQLPFGLLITDGKIRLLAHTPTYLNKTLVAREPIEQ